MATASPRTPVILPATPLTPPDDRCQGSKRGQEWEVERQGQEGRRERERTEWKRKRRGEDKEREDRKKWREERRERRNFTVCNENN